MVRECECGYCHELFTPALYGPAPTYCSGACRQAAYRERHSIGGRPQPHRRTSSGRKLAARRRLAA